MSATAINLPRRPLIAERLSLVSDAIKAAVPLAEPDQELNLLLQIGGKLLDNLNDYQAVDCWLVRPEPGSTSTH